MNHPVLAKHVWQWTAFLAIAAPVHAQILHGSEPLPSFEVATVRPWQPPPAPLATDGSPIMPKVKFSPGGAAPALTDRVHLIGQAQLLIASAYNIPFGREQRMIVGGPAWVGQESDRYEVQAKIEDSQFAAMKAMTPAEQRQQVALMEQSLLADRFKLKVHFEIREMPAYTLVVAKGGPKLTLAKDSEVTSLSSAAKGTGVEMTGTAVTLEQLAHSPLLGLNGAQAVDQTGISGKFDFTLDWTAASEAGVATDAPALLTAIQEQLGLRLVPSKAQVEVIVIDQIERPSGN